MHLIPYPKKITEYEVFTGKSFSLTAPEQDARLRKAVDKLPLSADGLPLELVYEISEGPLVDDSLIADEAYTLNLTNKGAKIEAKTTRGVFYGIQTLRQILENEAPMCCVIEDVPDFHHRGFYHDVTRGKIPTVETIKKIIDDLAYMKYNSLELYVEHCFEFEEFRDFIGETGALTAAEIREVDDYAYDNFIEHIPSIPTFGHLYFLLQQPKYAHLREAVDFKPYASVWHLRMAHHTIDPTVDESFEIVKSLIDQYLPLCRSEYFNICCDETFDLENGRHKDMDTGLLYVDFVTKIVNYVQSKGKKVMMWADIILKHMDYIDRLPENIYFLNWRYNFDVPEKIVSDIAETKRPQILCPGTNTWCRFVEDVDEGTGNIALMALFGKKYAAEGILNTNWGDYGNVCPWELSLYTTAVGAEEAWHQGKLTTEYVPHTYLKMLPEFDDAMNALFYHGKDGAALVKKLSTLQSNMSWRQFVRYQSNKEYDGVLDYVPITKENAVAVRDEAELIRKTILPDADIQEAFREEMDIALEALEVIAEAWAESEGFGFERLTDTDAFLKRFRAMWLTKNKESELKDVEAVFHYGE